MARHERARSTRRRDEPVGRRSGGGAPGGLACLARLPTGGLLALALACGGAPEGAAGAAPRDTVAVVLETDLGGIVVELYPDRAPITVANFLRYVDGGLYDGATFYRVVRPDNQPAEPRIEVIQGGLGLSVYSEGQPGAPLPPIEHEPTSRTGLRHVDGAISMGRLAVGTAASEFFITIGDQPSLDSGGLRNSDGQGFAAFGRLVSGMDLVRRIQAMPADALVGEEWAAISGQVLTEPVPIVRARRRPPRSPTTPDASDR